MPGTMTHASGFWRTFREAWLILSAILALTIGALLMLLAQILTLFHARRFCAEVIAAGGSKLMLWMSGVQLDVRGRENLPDVQAVYIINHTSLLDLYVNMSLSLPKTRYFMTRRCWRVPPLWMIAKLMRTFLTPPQSSPEARSILFRSASDVLRRTGDSVCLTPEGIRHRSGSLGPFNRGAFHLALSLQAPIIPIYMFFPPELEAGRTLYVRAGTAFVYILPAINISNWSLQQLDELREAVRAIFLEREAEIKATHGV